MVAEVLSGASMRSVARRCGVALSNVQRWVARAGERLLDEVDFGDRPSGPRCPHNRTSATMQERILQERYRLRKESDLGEYGPEAIHRVLQADPEVNSVPGVRTIGRILKRRGAVDARHRVRRRPPPRGWYLPDVADQSVELDSFDFIEEMTIQGGFNFEVFNGISVHGGLVTCSPMAPATSPAVVETLIRHWQQWGCPAYAQFDNDTRFTGPRQPAGAVGRVIRFCLGLGVSPVFVVPHEMGFQGAIESLNARWLSKVWTRFHFSDLKALQVQTVKYVNASRLRAAARIEAAPARSPFPPDWHLDYQRPLRGRIHFIRRTNERGALTLLNQAFPVDPLWAHRLVRCDVDIDAHLIQFIALRRSDPHFRLLLKEVHYELPKSVYPFHE